MTRLVAFLSRNPWRLLCLVVAGLWLASVVEVMGRAT